MDDEGAARVFIDGEAGTTGLGISRRLRAVAGISLLTLPAASRKDPEARREMMAAADLVVLCLPDAAAREAVALAHALGRPPRLLDASSAHRTAPGWVYGFPELDRGQAGRIAAAPLVANPGCYATGAIALLHPLSAADLLPPDCPVTVNAVSGYSGGGRTMIEDHERTGGPAFALYGLGLAHKHIPEMALHAGLSQPPLFVPSVGHFRQGMLVSVPLHLDALAGHPSAADLRAVLADHYRGAGLISVMAEEDPGRLAPDALTGTDRMEVFVFANEARRQALLVARLDNLGKGASGAAVQNLRLMLGLVPAAVETAVGDG